MQFIPYAERGGSDGFMTFYEFVKIGKENSLMFMVRRPIMSPQEVTATPQGGPST
jgi:hypothetical protein